MTNRPVLLLVGLTLLGGAWGYISAKQNVNPYPAVPAEDPNQAALAPKRQAWRPSPVWLPSYLVCVVPRRTIRRTNLPSGPMEFHVVGYGLESVNDKGYGFTSSADRTKYLTASMGVGGGFGLVAAVVICLAAGWVTVRKKRPDDDEA